MAQLRFDKGMEASPFLLAGAVFSTLVRVAPLITRSFWKHPIVLLRVAR